MRRFTKVIQRSILRSAALVIGGLGITAAMFPMDSQAIPIYARQTGQNCVACHAGGQFPELTPYGRKFKLTGYTIGTRVDVPLAVMGVVSSTRVSSDDLSGSGASPENGGFPHFTTASIFAGGKITDNIGLFGQWTYNGYGQNGPYAGHSGSDQFDLRYADRFIDGNRDLIVGASLNNNPGVTDVWNTFNGAFGSTPGYVPPSNITGVPGSATPQILNLGSVAAGMNVYAYWNDTVYAELGAYQTANGAFSFLSQGINDAGMTKLKGQFNPYVRLALNHDWGANSAMIGIYALNADIYSTPSDITTPTNSFHDVGFDGQYQYILDPHMFSAQFSYTKENQTYDSTLVDPTLVGGSYANPSNTLNLLKLKATYVYQAKYGASLGYSNTTGSADATLYPTASNINNTPNTTVWIPEVFYMPLQNVRVGVQYYKVTQFNGASSLYDGIHNASDNNTVFFYVWGAY